MPSVEMEEDLGDDAESLLSDTTSECNDISSASDDNVDDTTSKPVSGMANVMAKLLAKEVKSKKGPILCKAKSERELLARKKRKADDICIVAVDNDDKTVNVETTLRVKAEEEDKTDVKALTHIEQQEKKKRWEELGRVIPSVIDREKERGLQRIAIRGVVQFFNTVKKCQVQDDKTKTSTISKTKGQFLDMLHLPTASSKQSFEVKAEVKDEEETWNILRPDFLGDAPMQDWDKVEDN